jgi:hypothetical protein
MAERVKTWSRWAALCLALLVCVMGISTGYGAILLEGRDIVTADAKGADVLAVGGGDDIAMGLANNRLLWPALAVTPRVQIRSTALTDTQMVYIECIDGSGNAAADSVRISRNAEKVFTGPCASVFAINLAEVHGDSTNSGPVYFYHGAQKFATGDSQLAVIPSRWSKARHAFKMLPMGTSQVRVTGFEVLPTTVFSGFPSPKVGGNLMGHLIDSTATGRVALLGRDRQRGGWKELVGVNFRTTSGPVFVTPPEPYVFNVGEMAQLRVAAGVTGAATDIEVRVLGR